MNLPLDRVLARIDQIPALCPAAIEALAILESPDTDATSIEEIVRVDPLLAGAFLRVANASCFGLSGSVTTLRGAITRLGWKRTRDVISAAALRGVVPTTIPGYRSDARQFWAHCVATACLAERLCRDVGEAAPVAFVAGLLHDIGRLGIGSLIEELAPEATGLLAQNAITFEELEHDFVGIDHAEMGGRLARAWRLPDTIAQVCAQHHGSPAGDDTADRVARVVQVADVTAYAIGYGSVPALEDDREALHIDPRMTREHIERAVADCAEQLEELVDLFQVAAV